MQILFEHPWFIVINKPADLLTQAVEGINSVQTSLSNLLAQQSPGGPTPFIGVPHRLDRVTTGVMVLARNQRALKRLCEQFAARTVTKKYHALVESVDDRAMLERHESPVRWEDWIRKIPDEARGEVCSQEVEGARTAVLFQQVINHGSLRDELDIPERSYSESINSESINPAESGNLVVPTNPSPAVTLLELQLETGRMHQIRLQCAVRGYPVVGDSLYGSKHRWQTGEYRQEPIALHARSIAFRHPQTAEQLHFEAPYPDSWRRWVPQGET